MSSAAIKPHSNSLAWTIWCIALAFTLLQFLLQLSSGVIVAQQMTDFKLNAFGAGVLSSAYYYVYVMLQTPAGMLMDRYKPRILITGGAILCGVSTILYSFSQSMIPAFLLRLIMGTGGAVAFVGSVHLMREWFPANRFALLMGLTEATGMLATVLGTIGLATMIEHQGWRGGMLMMGILALIIAVLCAIFIRESPSWVAPEEGHISFLHRLRLVLSDKILFWNGLYCGILFSVLSVFSALWGVPFLQELAGYTLTHASAAASLVFIGAAVGTPCVGFLYTQYQSYRTLMFMGALLETVFLMLLIWLPYYSDTQLYILLFLNGLGCSFYILNFTLANDIAHPLAKSTATGYTNSLCVITAPIFQPIIGYLMADVAALHTNNVTATGYSLIDYQASLSILPAIVVLAAVIAVFLPEPNERFAADLQA